MRRKKLSKALKEAYVDDPESLLASNEFDKFDSSDFYSDINKDDPTAVKNAYNKAKNFKKNAVQGG